MYDKHAKTVLCTKTCLISCVRQQTKKRVAAVINTWDKSESIGGTVLGNNEPNYWAFMFGIAGQELQNYLVIFGNLALKNTWY